MANNGAPKETLGKRPGQKRKQKRSNGERAFRLFFTRRTRHKGNLSEERESVEEAVFPSGGEGGGTAKRLLGAADWISELLTRHN
jgi:hypothetical protein